MISDKAKAFLGERRFGVLATVGKDGVPHQTVMWYMLDSDWILMNTMRGRLKDRHLRRNQRVSLCIEDGYRYVTLAGRVDLIDDQETAQADIAKLAHHYEPADKAERMIANFQQQQRVTIRMCVEDIIASGFDE